MNSVVNIPLEKKEIMQALEKALQNQFIDNLRNRHQNVSLDSKLRGYVGEYAFAKWMGCFGIEFENSNQMDSKSGIDIDFLYRGKGKSLQLELKTSLIPEADETIAEMMQKRDIKLIKRGNQTIEDLKGDIHVQLVFKQLRIRKDEWLKKQHINIKATIENIYQKIAAYRYEKDTFIVGWIDKPTLVQQSKKKPEQLKQWSYGKRSFWTCNLLKEAKNPIDLIDYLQQQ